MTDPTIQQNLFPSEPTLADLLKMHAKSINLELNCHHVATIQSFNALKQTATATIVYKKTIFTRDADGNYQPTLADYPVLIDCPVIFLGGGKASLTFPVAAGDEALVLFNDRDIDAWFSGNPNGPVATPRLHAFPDAILLIGVRSLNKVLSGFDAVRTVLKNDRARVAVGPLLITVANDTQNLNTLLQNLCTQLQNLTTLLTALTVSGVSSGSQISGTPVNGPAIAIVGTAIGTIATNLAGLLE